MTTPTDAHLLAAIKAAGQENRWTPHQVRHVAKNEGGYLARSIHAHAVTLARVEIAEGVIRALLASTNGGKVCGGDGGTYVVTPPSASAMNDAVRFLKDTPA